MSKLKLKQAIVVEGRDDVSAVSEAVEALIIPTHGFGITKETWQLIDKANKEKGLIILTDPDFSGEEIRRKLSEKFPQAIHAYIDQEDAKDGDDIGVENASSEVIVNALEKSLKNKEHLETDKVLDPVSIKDLVRWGLVGADKSSEKRRKLCAKLGIGYGNAKGLIKKLSQWNIGIKEFEQAIKEIE